MLRALILILYAAVALAGAYFAWRAAPPPFQWPSAFLVLFAAAVARMISNYRSERAGAKKAAGPERSQLTRRGIVDVLWSVLEEAKTREALPKDCGDDLLSYWKKLLKEMIANEATMESILPPDLSNSLWEALWRPDARDEDAQVFLRLIRGRLTSDELRRQWSDEDALRAAGVAMPLMRNALATKYTRDGTVTEAGASKAANQGLNTEGAAEKQDQTPAELAAGFGIVRTELRVRHDRELVVPSNWREPPLFIGREDSLAAMAQWLLASPLKPVSVCGVSGLGKSTLCERLAWNSRTRFEKGGYARITIEPHSSDSPEDLLRKIGECFGVEGSIGEIESLLTARLKEPVSLVHIENVDENKAGRAVAKLATKLPGCALIISGRTGAVGRREDWETLELKPFGLDQALTQLAREYRAPSGQGERAEQELLVEQCGFLPQAIHLCAGHLKAGLKIGEILPKVPYLGPRDQFDLAWEKKARALLASTFDLSWELYEGRLKELKSAAGTRNVCAFAAAPLCGAGDELGAAICGLSPEDFNAAMTIGVSLSVAIREAPAGGDEKAAQHRISTVWRLHRLIREFFEAKHPAATREGWERLANWFLERIPESSGTDAWDQVSQEATALAAWLDSRNGAQAQQAARAGLEYARRRGAHRTWGRVGETAMQRGDPFDDWAMGGMLATEMAQSAGDPEESKRLASLVRDRARRFGRTHWAALLSGQIADILYQQGNLTEALRILREDELPVYEKLGDVRSKAQAQGRMAEILYQQGDPTEALRILREDVLPFCDQMGEVRSKAVAQGRVADILFQQGDLTEALRILREDELPAWEKLGDVRSKAVAQGRIADILYQRGDLNEALRIRREDALPVYEKLADVRSKAMTQGDIADILYQQGDLTEALRIHREDALPVYERLGEVRWAAWTRGQIAGILSQQGNLDEAFAMFANEVLPVFEKLGDIRMKAITQPKAAIVFAGGGDLAEAARLCRDAMAALEKTGAKLQLVWARFRCARVHASAGAKEEARERATAVLTEAVQMGMGLAAGEIRTFLAGL